MDSWRHVAASLLFGLLLLVSAVAATAIYDSSWPLRLAILAMLSYLVAFGVRDVRRGKTYAVAAVQKRRHQFVIAAFLVVALIVLWLAR